MLFSSKNENKRNTFDFFHIENLIGLNTNFLFSHNKSHFGCVCKVCFFLLKFYKSKQKSKNTEIIFLNVNCLFTFFIVCKKLKKM
jgi:hypothetical protein